MGGQLGAWIDKWFETSMRLAPEVSPICQRVLTCLARIFLFHSSHAVRKPRLTLPRVQGKV